MRKPTTNSERSKVRIFYVEGDFAPGDMQDLTQAMANAIRPTQVILRGAPAQRLALPAADGTGAAVVESELESVDAEATGELEEERPVARGPAKPRTYRKPEAVAIDLNAGQKPWKDFVTEKGPTSHRSKYLVAATWLHDHADIKTVTADHVFTCYKAAGWNFDVIDPTATFRQLRKDRLGTLDHGSFSINQLGISEVNDMKASA